MSISIIVRETSMTSAKLVGSNATGGVSQIAVQNIANQNRRDCIIEEVFACSHYEDATLLEL